MIAPRDLLVDENATATAIFEAAKMLLGPSFIAWEPDTIWMELADNNIDMDEVNRDKLMAASTLIQTDGFYWDAAVYENITMAFNNLPMIPDAIQEASPAQLSWAVFEASYFRRHEYQEPETFDREPMGYTAVCLHRSGFVVAPEMLSFAQTELDKLNQGAVELKATVQKRWSSVNTDELAKLELAETPSDVQISYLAAVHLYVEERARQLKRELASLSR